MGKPFRNEIVDQGQELVQFQMVDQDILFPSLNGREGEGSIPNPKDYRREMGSK